MSTVKAELHSLIDSLSENQANKLKKVVSLFVTEFMSVDRENNDKNQAFLKTLSNAPEDDEPLTADDLSAIAEAEADIKAGRVQPLADVAKEFGL
ncbi:MAG TPA: hypothetical protein VHY08_23785 [Bacillota bacterium]|nr:hypothetical protein [Bacillota bacterium]